MRLLVIILIYNGSKYLPDLIKSLKITHYSGDWQVLFIDNNSQDNSLTLLQTAKQTFTFKYQILSLPTNLGFAAGNNVGLKYFLASGYEGVVLLNQDTVVGPNWLTNLAEAVKESAGVGAVQPLILYWPPTRRLIQSRGNCVHFLGFEFTDGNLENLSYSKLPTLKKITYCSGACVLYTKAALREVGLLDEIFFSYHEDADICLRMKLKGFNSYLTTKAVIYHKYEFLRSIKKYYLMERGRFYSLIKFYKWQTLLIIAPALLIMEIGLLLFALKRNFWREKLRVYLWLIKNWRLIKKKRQEIQRSRKINDRQLTNDFTAKISHQEIDNPLLNFIANPLMAFYWFFVRKIMWW